MDSFDSKRHTLKIRVGKLKFLQDQPDNGIFLIRESKTETKITVIVENKPARLITYRCYVDIYFAGRIFYRGKNNLFRFEKADEKN